MHFSIESIERITLKAKVAALRYSNVNDACPYPFASPAGQAFKTEFAKARAEIEATKEATAS